MKKAMNSKWVDRVFLIFGFVLVVFIYASLTRDGKVGVIHTSDTTYIYDTIIQPVAKDSAMLCYKYIKLPVMMPSDTVFSIDTLVDSVVVEVPIEQKIYEDSTYKAWVSGFQPNLDSIVVRGKTINNNTIIYQKPKKWGIGVQVGGGFGSKGVTPYVGVGIQYNILTL